MAEPFLAEIKIVAFEFAPRGWAKCDGQILPIPQNFDLFLVLRNTFGGGGGTTFALPDLRGRAPMHDGPLHGLGSGSGQEIVTLSASQLPPHRHLYRATCEGATSSDPTGGKVAPTTTRSYRGSGNRVTMNAEAIADTGGGQPHNNMQPYVALNMVIALQGTLPSK